MDGKDFKKIVSPKNVYCLVSTDAEMIDLYINRFKEMIGADEVNYGSIKAYGKLFRKKILNVLYMPKLNEDIFESQGFVFVHTDSIDKRTALYKKYQSQIIELNNDYTNFIINNSDMSKEEAQQLAKINDLGIIKSRLTIYKESKTSYNDIGDIYSWAEAFIRKTKLPSINDSPISVMALLSNNCSTLLKILSNNTKGLNPYIVSKMSSLKTCRTEEELHGIISDCFYLDCQIKKGLISVDNVLNYLISKYWR